MVGDPPTRAAKHEMQGGRREQTMIAPGEFSAQVAVNTPPGKAHDPHQDRDQPRAALPLYGPQHESRVGSPHAAFPQPEWGSKGDLAKVQAAIGKSCGPKGPGAPPQVSLEDVLDAQGLGLALKR